jgi:hemerythrin-like domain-containing protein
VSEYRDAIMAQHHYLNLQIIPIMATCLTDCCRTHSSIELSWLKVIIDWISEFAVASQCNDRIPVLIVTSLSKKAG